MRHRQQTHLVSPQVPLSDNASGTEVGKASEPALAALHAHRHAPLLIPRPLADLLEQAFLEAHRGIADSKRDLAHVPARGVHDLCSVDAVYFAFVLQAPYLQLAGSGCLAHLFGLQVPAPLESLYEPAIVGPRLRDLIGCERKHP